ncbi:hypothetical protein DFH28DRAFT_879833 [Melampsora americana]|nr:hypothetical protein DFH28DRAFT_879833 [Melampsora americana]
MSGIRKVISNSKETESGSIINMLTNNQNDNNVEEQSNPAAKDAGSESNNTVQQNDSIQPDQGNPEKSKASGPNHQDQGNSEKSKNAGPTEPLQESSLEEKSGTTLDGKELVNPNYLSILGSKPVKDKEAIHISINSDNENSLDEEINMSNKEEVFAKAMELTLIGDCKEAAKYLKIYGLLAKHQVDRPSATRAASSNIVTSDNTKTVPEGAVFENGMWFFPGRTSNYDNRSYTPYFDKNIQELWYPIPLTIFDKDWQNRAMTCHVKKRSRLNNDLKPDAYYNGLPYADEWLLDYGEWSLYYNTFFTKWAKAHKANVAKVLGSMGWMTALKYDMRVRESALVNRIEIDGKVAPPDISEYNHMLAEECWGESRMRDKLNFKKNPYVEGGEREGWDPATGKPPKKPFEKAFQSKNRNYQKWNNGKIENKPIASTSTFHQREKKKFKRGYQGNNYDKNYAEKKAAATANAKDLTMNK